MGIKSFSFNLGQMLEDLGLWSKKNYVPCGKDTTKETKDQYVSKGRNGLHTAVDEREKKEAKLTTSH